MAKKAIFIVILLLCAGCATPRTQPVVSSNVIVNQELPLKNWMPRGKPKAIIIALHGFNDYSHAFAIPAETLQQSGIALYSYDQRGFGESPQTGIWAGEENLIRDAANTVTQVKNRYPHTPVYVLGESMGGAVAVAALSRPDFPHVDGLILAAPAVWGSDTMSFLWRASLWVFAHTWPQKTLTGEELHVLPSDNIPMLRKLVADPLTIKKSRVDAIYGLVKLMNDASKKISDIHVPILLLYGAHDQVIPPPPIRAALEKISSDVTVAYYPKGYHMLLRDLHRDAPLEDIISWIKNKECPLPSGREEDPNELLASLEDIKPAPWQHNPLRVIR